MRVTIFILVKRHLLLFLFHQHATQYFSDLGLRQFGAEFDQGWYLVRGQTLFAEVANLFDGSALAFLEHDKGLDRFAPFGVRHAHDGCFHHLGVHKEDLFNLAWHDVVAAGDDQVLLAIHDEEVTIGVHRGDVARVEPAVSVDGIRSFLRIVVVALHDLGPRTTSSPVCPTSKNPISPCSSDSKAMMASSVLGNGMPTEPVLVWPKTGLPAVSGEDFGHAVAFHQLAARHFLKLLRHFGRQWSAAAQTDPDAVQVIVGHFGMVDDGNIHGRHTGIERNFLPR